MKPEHLERMHTESDLLALARFCLQQAAEARDGRTAEALRRMAQGYEDRADQLRIGGSNATAPKTMQTDQA
jgi:hypothetical protein